MARTESERAIDLAYRALARRERTVAELRTCLERKRVRPEAIDDAVAELAGRGLPRRRPLRAPLRRGQARARPAGAASGSSVTSAGAALPAHLIEEVVSDARARRRAATALVLLLEQRNRRRARGRSRARPRLADAGPQGLRAGDRLRRGPGSTGSPRAPPSGIGRSAGCRSRLAGLSQWKRPAWPARDQKTCNSPDLCLDLTLSLTTTDDQPERSVREGP